MTSKSTAQKNRRPGRTAKTTMARLIKDPVRGEAKEKVDSICKGLEGLIRDDGRELLFLRIVTQAIQDMIPRKMGCRGRDGQYQNHSAGARRFFIDNGHRYFCEMIDIDPDYVTRILRRAGLI